LVYGRRGDLEVLLHFGLRGWRAVDFSVVVNERQVLALLVGVGSLHRKLSVRAGLTSSNLGFGVDLVGVDIFRERLVDGPIEAHQKLHQGFISTTDQHSQTSILVRSGSDTADRHLELSLFGRFRIALLPPHWRKVRDEGTS